MAHKFSQVPNNSGIVDWNYSFYIYHIFIIVFHYMYFIFYNQDLQTTTEWFVILLARFAHWA